AAPSLALVAHRRAALPSRLGPPASGTGAWPSSSPRTPAPLQLHPSSKFAHRAPFRPSSDRGPSGTVPSRLAASSPTSSAPPPSSSSSDAKLRTALAATALVVLDVQFRSLFRRYSVPFPSSLAGCGALFASMLLLDAFGGRGEGLYRALNPGATALAKWLPVFFVPSLIALPLASGLGDAREVLKLLAVIVGGFFFTLFTTAWSVLGVRKLTGGGSGSDSAKADVVQTERVASTTPVTNPPPKAFGKTLFRSLKALAWIAGISTVALVKTSTTSTWIGPMQSAFLLFVTLSTFVFGANLPKPFTKVVHPLVTCTGLTWLAANVLARLTGSTFLDVLRSYKVGTLAPMSAGAGDVLLFLLGPAVVALACQMYGRKKLVRENLAEVGTATAVSSVGGLYGTAAAVRLLGMANPAIRLSLLSRNITSPLAMAVASILGADVSLAVTIVVVTGLFGANFGASILDAFGIKDAVARGLGIGAAAHGLGTAAFANEGDAFPFAAIAMALTASAITVLVSVPGVKRSVMNLALGV
ncbi:hypothetical protein ACHAWF_011009, partial [Thalassiosira exigua]